MDSRLICGPMCFEAVPASRFVRHARDDPVPSRHTGRAGCGPVPADELNGPPEPPCDLRGRARKLVFFLKN